MRVGAVGSYSHVMTNDKIKDKKACLKEISNQERNILHNNMNSGLIGIGTLAVGVMASKALKTKSPLLSGIALTTALIANVAIVGSSIKNTRTAYKAIEENYEQADSTKTII